MKVKEKPKYNIVQNVSWMVKIAWKTRKRVLLNCALTAILEVLLNLTQLYIAPEVLKQVEQKSPIWMLLPGNILKVNVTVGQAVKEGEVLVVLEAMKMENEIMAPKAGTVAQVLVQKGATVDTGATMVVLN